MVVHLFYTKHELNGGLKFFDYDYDIAESVRRLRSGNNIQPHDLILIQHEALETDLMSTGLLFEEAHAKAEEKFNYSLALLVYLKENGLE